MHPKTHAQIMATCIYNAGEVKFTNYCKYYKDYEKKRLFKNT